MASSLQGAPSGAPAARFFSILDSPEYIRSKILYERRPVTQLWNKLTVVAKQQFKWKNVPDKKGEMGTADKRILQVHGPPGSGKSSATYSWVSRVCRDRNIQALWISCANANGECWAMAMDQTAGSVEATPRAVPFKDDAGGFPIVVFDGVRAGSVETWRGLMNHFARIGILVLIASSEGVSFHEGDANDILLLEFLFPSWTMEEYAEACKADVFWKDSCMYFEGATESDSKDRRLELLNQKFEVAGHSARFMFRRYTVKVSETILARVQRMGKSEGGSIGSLQVAIQSDRSSGAVNTLISRLQHTKNGPTPQGDAVFPSQEDFDAEATSVRDLGAKHDEWDPKGSFPLMVSAAATVEVMKHIPDDPAKLRDIGHGLKNQPIVGYALELQLKKKLKEARNPGTALALTWSSSGELFTLDVSNVHFCSTQAEVISRLAGRTGHTANAWIFIAGRQGAFDAIHIAPDQRNDPSASRRFRFVQVTAGASHPFKLSIIDALLKKLFVEHSVSCSHLEFMILRPEDDLRNFRLTPEGKVQSYHHFDGRLWDTSDYRNNVEYAAIAWD